MQVLAGASGLDGQEFPHAHHLLRGERHGHVDPIAVHDHGHVIGRHGNGHGQAAEHPRPLDRPVGAYVDHVRLPEGFQMHSHILFRPPLQWFFHAVTGARGMVPFRDADAPNASTAAADGLSSGMTAYVGRIPSSCSFDRFPGMFRGMVRVSVFSDWVLDVRGVIRDRTGGGDPLRSAWIAALPVWFFWLTAKSSSSGVSRVMALPFPWVWSYPVASKSLGRLPRCRRVG